MTDTQQQNEEIRLTIISVFDAEYKRIHKLNWKPFLKKMGLLWNPPPKEEKVGHKDALAHSEAILPPKTSKQKRYVEELRKCFNCTQMVPKKRLRCEACAKAWHNLGRDKREKLQVKVKCWDCDTMIPENQKRCAPCRKIHNPAAMRESQKALYRARKGQALSSHRQDVAQGEAQIVASGVALNAFNGHNIDVCQTHSSVLQGNETVKPKSHPTLPADTVLIGGPPYGTT